MKLSYSFLRKVLATGLALAAVSAAGLAQAGDVYWSVGVNTAPGVAVTAGNVPRVMVAPAPVYVAPAPVYVAPAPVYMAPPPVVVTPAPRVYYAPPPVYRPAPVYYSGYYEEPRQWIPPGHRKHHHNGYRQLRY